jgi:predicted dehydrogenase/threonine dehydrogenase-like Zn-dependent dehydrogenase
VKQVVRRGLKEIIVDTIPDPTVAPHHVVIRTHHSLISAGTETASIHTGSVLSSVAENPSHLRTVWNAMQSAGPERTIDEVRAKFKDYAVLGYAGAGTVAEVHPTVTDLQVGQRVAYGGEGTGHGESIMTGRNLVARVPDPVSTEEAAFATLGSIALHAVRNAELSLGDSVAVIGLGLVGQLVAQLARAQGARVIAMDLDASRVELARTLGASVALQGGDSASSAILAATDGRGVDCTIIAAAAKSTGPALQALAITRERGRIVVVGAVELQFPYFDMFKKELSVRMSRAYGPGSYDPEYERGGRDYPYAYVRWTENRNMEEFLRRIEVGDVQVKPLISHHFKLDDAPEAYRSIMDPSVRSLAVVLEYPVLTATEPFKTQRRIETGVGAAAGAMRFALVGAGNIARWAHLPALKKAGDASLHAVVSSNGAKGKALASRFGAKYVTTELAQALADQDVGAVLIASRNQAHARQVVAALHAGKHVLVEKPMAVTAEECREILAAQTESGHRVGVAFNRRYAPMYVKLKKALARKSGPAVITARMNSPYMSGDSWMTDPAAGGAVVGEACHMTDLLSWLVDADPVRVTAQCLPLGKKDPAGENNIVASISFSDGSIASLMYCAVGDKKAGGERVEVYASGIAAWSEDFKKFAAGKARPDSSFFPDKGYDAQMEDFVSSVKAGRDIGANAVAGARATLTCLAMLASARDDGRGYRVDMDAVQIVGE